MRTVIKVVSVCVALASLHSAAAAGVRGPSVEEQFIKYIEDFGKSYEAGSHEFSVRLAFFEENLRRIEEGNAIERSAGNPESPFGLTKFSDMSAEEFAKTHLTYKPVANRDSVRASPLSLQGLSAPASMDWRDHTPKVVTPVKNQGDCGSCWAFSATENTESMWALAGNGLFELAPQQLVSCDKVDGGCDGGDLPTAFEYIHKAGGLETEREYPYLSGVTGVNGKCHALNDTELHAPVQDWYKATTRRNETELLVSVANIGPLAICVDADTWNNYNGGIVRKHCGKQLDHCVQLVGYGTSADGIDYWIVRNSWAADWGEDGYIRIERGDDLCGIAQEAYYATF